MEILNKQDSLFWNRQGFATTFQILYLITLVINLIIHQFTDSIISLRLFCIFNALFFIVAGIFATLDKSYNRLEIVIEWVLLIIYISITCIPCFEIETHKFVQKTLPTLIVILFLSAYLYMHAKLIRCASTKDEKATRSISLTQKDILVSAFVDTTLLFYISNI